MYKIYLSNFGYFKECVYSDIKSAINACKIIGFECSIHDITNNYIVASYSPISGFRGII
jgi:hypothetical protein